MLRTGAAAAPLAVVVGSRYVVCMRAAILGTGEVGQSIATRLLENGHEAIIAGRSRDSETGTAWATAMTHRGYSTHCLEYAEAVTWAAAAGADAVVFLCVRGSAVSGVLEAIAPVVEGMILVDVTNGLSFPDGGPLELLVANNDSLGELIQRALPRTSVVKALNTVGSHTMTHPREIGSGHFAPIAGNDPAAKERVRTILQDEFDWETVIDLGEISAARGMEAYLHLWLHLWKHVGHARFNIAIVAGEQPQDG